MSAPLPWASVLVPVKDEVENLTPLTDGLLKVMHSHPLSQSRPFEIIYIDDGSTDGSSELLDRLAAEHREVRTFHFDRNHGKTAALDAAFKQSSGDIIVHIDADLQQDNEDILSMLPLTERYDVVCGWRKDRQDNLVRKLSSRIANFIRNIFTRDGIHDTGCPLKIFRRPVCEKLCLFEGLHRFFPALALMHGFTITEVPVRHYPRLHGVSKFGVGNRLFKSLYDLIAVRWMHSRVLRYRFRSSPVTK
ncbi:Glycosyl transferase, family 2 [Nitrospira japonica]|uniref:Glycosyl transferase, family 2 n=1 Tax=Nitrospira japonica TaxID=1325564 RepID=A0A1W1I1J0_9BACT|nr:glycosyltransferase family 2 protein [Nitrospira japonica]SLM46886.1 Glycosyl transferase, family 2 [Nitrospira japonica]